MASVAIFIDGGYLEKVMSNQFSRTRIDFKKLSNEIAKQISADATIIRTYYYHSSPYQSNPPTKEESERYARKERFFASLERLPRYEVRRGRVGRRGPDKNGNYKYEQKMVDVLLSIDLVKFSSKGKITHAVLIAGDGDFVPAVKMAKDEAVIVYLVYGESRHDALWKEVDERMEITQEFVERVKWT